MKSRLHLTSFGAMLIAAAAGHASDVRFQTIVLSGDPAPGLAGLAFDWFSDPRVTWLAGSPHRIAFWADVAGPGVTTANNGTLWSNRSGTLALVAREGDPSPVAGLAWGAFPSPTAQRSGNSSQAFELAAALVDPGQPALPINVGLFREATPGGAMLLVAREGSPATGLPAGTNFSNFSGPFGAGFFTGNKGAALWQTGPTQLTPLIRAGDPAPGVSGGFIGFVHTPLARGGGYLPVATTLFTNSTQAGEPSGAALYKHAGGLLTLAAVTGGPAFGTGSTTFKELSAQPRMLNVFERVAFWASVAGPAVTAANDAGLFVTSSGTSSPLRVREGDNAPGVGPGVFFSGFSRQFDTEGGSQSFSHIAFRASLVGNGVSNLNNSGVWLFRQNSQNTYTQPALVAREGDQVPRLPAGTFFASFTDPIINAEGQVVFLARLRGPAVTQPTSVVLMATEQPETGPEVLAAGRLTPLVRTGDAFDVGGGQLRNVDQIILEPGDEGAGTLTFAGNGALVFKLHFRDPIAPPPPLPSPPFSFTEGLFTATTRCLADINADGGLTIADFAAFQAAYASSNLRVCDFSEDGLLSFGDFAAFQAAFVDGCP